MTEKQQRSLNIDGKFKNPLMHRDPEADCPGLGGSRESSHRGFFSLFCLPEYMASDTRSLHGLTRLLEFQNSHLHSWERQKTKDSNLSGLFFSKSLWKCHSTFVLSSHWFTQCGPAARRAGKCCLLTWCVVILTQPKFCFFGRRRK